MMSGPASLLDEAVCRVFVCGDLAHGPGAAVVDGCGDEMRYRPRRGVSDVATRR